MHLTRNDAALSRNSRRRVLDDFYQVEKRARLVARGGIIDQDRALLQYVALPFKQQTDQGIEQGMAGANEGGGGCSGRLISAFSKQIRSYLGEIAPMPRSFVQVRMTAGTLWMA